MKQNPEAQNNIQILTSGKLTFYVAPHRIGLETGFQFFSIEGVDQYCKKHVATMRELILQGSIQCLTDFYDNSNGKVRLNYSQKRWFYDAVERIDPKPEPVPDPIPVIIEDLLLEPDSTDVHLQTAIMVVEV